jgi:ABC-type glycerol-3-phosphate transport system substrate-binding protein
VAPGALPDLTLVRRSDLLEAVQSGLLQRLRISASIVNDLHPAVADLGNMDDVTYGLAYMVDVEHLAISQDAVLPERWRFEDVLEAHFAYVFPAGRTNTLSDSFLVQYLNAALDLTAGQDLLLNGELAIDANVLRSVYEFYERAVEADVIDSLVLEYITDNDYATSLAQGDVPAGVVTSTLYLTLLDDGAALDYGLIPTQTGQPATVVDGWLWVITTSDAGQQEAALRFLNWMMNVDRQGAYASAVHMLPSLRTALRAWSDTGYAAFVDSLLTQATLPLSDIGGGTPARVMQSALAMVISGQRTADQATREVIAQLSG